MPLTLIVITILGLAFYAFGHWGRFSQSGQRAYDEMAGMIPLFSHYLGILLLCISALWWAILLYRWLG